MPTGCRVPIVGDAGHAWPDCACSYAPAPLPRSLHPISSPRPSILIPASTVPQLHLQAALSNRSGSSHLASLDCPGSRAVTFLASCQITETLCIQPSQYFHLSSFASTPFGRL